MLSRLDHALMRTESAGHAEVEYIAYGAHEAPRSASGEGEWQYLLSEALADPQPQQPPPLSLAIFTQAYAGPPDPQGQQDRQERQERHEASLELHDSNGQTLTGALFLPVAVRLGLSADFDLRAIALGLQWLQQHAGAPLIVRVSLPSLGQAHFLGALQALLAQAPLAALTRLILELDAHGTVAYPDELQALCTLVHHSGASIGLRRLDHQPMALPHLHALPLAYVKLGSDFAAQSSGNPGSRHLLQAMAQTAHDLGLRVYVTAGTVDAATTALLLEQGAYVPVPQ